MPTADVQVVALHVAQEQEAQHRSTAAMQRTLLCLRQQLLLAEETQSVCECPL